MYDLDLLCTCQGLHPGWEETWWKFPFELKNAPQEGQIDQILLCSHFWEFLELIILVFHYKGKDLWPWSYGSWIYNYLCNQCLSSLMLWVRISIGVRCTTLCDKVCQWLAVGQWFSLSTLVTSIDKTDCHDITEILLKVALNTINQTKPLQGDI